MGSRSKEPQLSTRHDDDDDDDDVSLCAYLSVCCLVSCKLM